MPCPAHIRPDLSQARKTLPGTRTDKEQKALNNYSLIQLAHFTIFLLA